MDLDEGRQRSLRESGLDALKHFELLRQQRNSGLGGVAPMAAEQQDVTPARYQLIDVPIQGENGLRDGERVRRRPVFPAFGAFQTSRTALSSSLTTHHSMTRKSPARQLLAGTCPWLQKPSIRPL